MSFMWVILDYGKYEKSCIKKASKTYKINNYMRLG